MAKFKLSALFSECTGKLEGSCFANFQGQTILKNRTIQVGNRTQGREKNKYINQLIKGQWSQLSVEKKETWKAVFDGLKNGYSLYYSLNYWNAYQSRTLFENPPYSVESSEEFDFTPYVSSGGLSIILNRNLTSSFESIVVKCSYLVSAGITSTKIQTKIIKVASVESNEFNISTEYEEIFGRQLVNGDRILISVAIVNNSTGKISSSVDKYYTVESMSLFDELSETPSLAMGFYLYNNSYLGPLVRIFNAATAQFQDFYPVNGAVSADEINTWLGGDPGYIYQLYDQSLNGNALTFSLGSNQCVWDGSLYANFNSSAVGVLSSVLPYDTSLRQSFCARIDRESSANFTALFADISLNPEEQFRLGSPFASNSEMYYNPGSRLYMLNVPSVGNHFDILSVESSVVRTYVDEVVSPAVVTYPYSFTIDTVGSLSNRVNNNFKLFSFFFFENTLTTEDRTLLQNFSY